MIWYAHISNDSTWPSKGKLLHLQGIRTVGREAVATFETATELRAFLDERPEIGLVNFYAAWMPARPVLRAKVTDALLRRLFSK
jgi:hypothetical protein